MIDSEGTLLSKEGDLEGHFCPVVRFIGTLLSVPAYYCKVDFFRKLSGQIEQFRVLSESITVDPVSHASISLSYKLSMLSISPFGTFRLTSLHIHNSVLASSVLSRLCMPWQGPKPKRHYLRTLVRS
jgi:hypothetical protein